MPDKTALDQKMKDFVKGVSECAEVCLYTHAYCMRQGGEHAESMHMNVMMDCDKICDTTAKYGLRESENLDQLARVCGDICRQCAESCEQDQFADDEKMQTCAETCRECQEMCEKWAE